MEVLSLVLKCKSTYKTSNSFLLICFQCWFVEAFRSFLTCSHAIAFGSLISEGVTLQLYTELSALKKRNFIIQVSLKSLQHIPIMTISLFQNVNWTCIRSSQDVYVLRPCQFNIFELNPANTSTSNQRWLSMFIDVVLKLIFVWRWRLSRCIFINVVSTLIKIRWSSVLRFSLFQRWLSNVVLIKPRFVHWRSLNVDKTLKQCLQSLLLLFYLGKWVNS